MLARHFNTSYEKTHDASTSPAMQARDAHEPYVAVRQAGNAAQLRCISTHGLPEVWILPHWQIFVLNFACESRSECMPVLVVWQLSFLFSLSHHVLKAFVLD